MQLGWFAFNEMDYEGIPIKPLGQGYTDSESVRLWYKEFKPDVVISLGDIRMIEKLIYEMEDYEFRSRWIHWLPVDGEPYPEVYDDQIQNIEHLVVLSDFGYDVYKDRVRTGLYKIYHGLDPDAYKPLDNRDYLRARNGFHNRFICLMVAQNQWRKNIPAMIESFAKFSKDKDNVDLVIHTKPESVAGMQGWDINELVRMHNLQGKVRISYESYTTLKMNRLYNCANLLVSSTQGEGFGLPHVEAMFAGIPLLLPDYTTSREQVLPNDDESRRCGSLVKIKNFFLQSLVNVKRAQIDTDDCAEKLESYYRDWLHGEVQLRTQGKMGRKNAQEFYDINRIVLQWERLIQQVVLQQKESIFQSTDIPITLKEIR